MATVTPATRGPDVGSSRPFPPLRERATVVLCAWLPVIILAVFGFPRFAPVFDRIRERQPLPRLTEWAMALARLGPEGSLAGGFALVTLLIVVGSWTEELKGDVRWVWFFLSVGSGLVAFLVSVLALLLPVFELGTRVK